MHDTRRSPLVTLLVVLLAGQTALIVGATVYLVVGLVQADAQFPPTAFALTALVILIAVWLVAMTVGVHRGRAWTRGSVLTYEFLQLAIGVGSVQGFTPRPDIGWWVIATAVGGLVLILSTPVTTYLDQRD
jgi:type III secretory pathway component EscS